MTTCDETVVAVEPTAGAAAPADRTVADTPEPTVRAAVGQPASGPSEPEEDPGVAVSSEAVVRAAVVRPRSGQAVPEGGSSRVVAPEVAASAAVVGSPAALSEPTGRPLAPATEPAPRLRKLLAEDIATVLAKDPAASSRAEVLLYPHIHALWTYRIAHRLWRRGHRFVPRALSLLARAVSGIEIHPGARIGRRFFVDHGTAVVIGETVRIGDDVMLYHQVTLGSVGWWKDLRRPAGSRRHPVVGDRVIIGTGASVLGPVTVGSDSRVGAHAIVLDDLPPHSRVVAPTCEVLPALDTGAPEPVAPEPVAHEPAAPALDELASQAS